MDRRYGMPQLREISAQPITAKSESGFQGSKITSYGHAGTMREACAQHRATDARINKVANAQVKEKSRNICTTGTIGQRSDNKRRRDGEQPSVAVKTLVINPQLMAAYRIENIKDLNKCQHLYAPGNYIHELQDISPNNRCVLVDWLIEIHYKYQMRPETLYISISLLDKFLVKRPETRRKFVQVVGGGCLLLAAKFEEVETPPSVSDIVTVMGHAGTAREVTQCECDVWSTLEYEVYVPTPFQFLLAYCAEADILLESDVFFLAMFFLDCTLLDTQFLVLTPSQRASCCLYLACAKLKIPRDWRAVWEHSEDKVRYWAQSLNHWFPRYRHMAVFRKFSRVDFNQVVRLA